MKLIIKELLFITLFFCTIPTHGQSYRSILIGKETKWTLGNSIYYFSSENFINANDAFNHLKKVQASPLTSNSFKRGYDSKYYWFYLKLENDAIAKTLVLTFSRSDIHHFNCFAKKGERLDTLAITGDALPFGSRPIKVNDYATPISLKSNEITEILVFVDKRFEFIEGEFNLYESNYFFRLNAMNLAFLWLI